MAGLDSVNEFFSSSESTQSMQLSSVDITFVCTALTVIIVLGNLFVLYLKFDSFCLGLCYIVVVCFL